MPEILETNESRLKKALRIAETDELPEHVVDLYWKAERACRVIKNSGISDELLVLIALMSGGGEAPLSTFLDVAPKTSKGSPVQAKFKNRWVSGKYIGTKKNRVVVALEDDSEATREFGANEVRLYTRAEAELVGV